MRWATAIVLMTLIITVGVIVWSVIQYRRSKYKTPLDDDWPAKRR